MAPFLSYPRLINTINKRVLLRGREKSPQGKHITLTPLYSTPLGGGGDKGDGMNRRTIV